MASYKGSGFIAVAATKTPLLLGGGTTVRPRLTSYALSTDGVPGTEAELEYKLANTSDLGTTSTNVTPAKCDQADPAARATMRSNMTAEPTYTTTIFDFSFNPRLIERWFAENQEAEIVVPAVASAGLGVQCVAVGGAVGVFRANMSFRE